MPKHGQKQNENTRRATRRNYALYQTMGMAAATEQVRQLAGSMSGEGSGEVFDATKGVADALDALVVAIEAWDPNK